MPAAVLLGDGRLGEGNIRADEASRGAVLRLVRHSRSRSGASEPDDDGSDAAPAE